MTTLLIFAVACLFTASVQGQPVQQAQPPVQVTSYQFLDTIITSLARSHMAIQAVNEKADDPSLVERMTAIQNGMIELNIAKGQIQHFTSASGERVRDSTTASIDAYDFMRKSLEMLLGLYEKLDAANSTDDLVGMRRQMSDAKVLYQQASAILVDATTIAFAYAIVADPQDPENHVALDMTKEEKEQLVKALELRFGAIIRKKADDDTGPMQAAKALLVILEQKWRHAK